MTLDRDDAESLAQELSLLRKNEGFIQRRLFKAAIVDEVLRGSYEDTFERLKSRFLSAIYTLEQDESVLLLDIFALSPETEGVAGLEQRRQIHGARIGTSKFIVASREEPALRHLHSRLVTGTYAQSPLVLHVPEMHGGIIYEAVSILVIVENRKWRETREYYRFANMTDDLQFVTVSRSHEGRAISQPGGDFKVNTRPVEGAGYNDHFWHLDQARTKTEAMIRGEIYDLRFTVQSERSSDEQEPVKLASCAFHDRTLLVSIQVGFVGDKPRSLWKFERVSPFARLSSANEHNTIDLNDQGVATLRLRDVYGGLFSGIAWEWYSGETT